MSRTAFREERLEKNREQSLRRCRSRGLMMRKSRCQLSLDNQGGYMLADINRNWIVAGGNFELSLDDVETWLQ